MLAYVFWHWPVDSVPVPDYAARLTAYHATLRAHPPVGFVSSTTFEVATLPFHAPDAPPAPPYFEDWYLLRDFTALGMLNEAAVRGARQPAHDMVAAQAAGGLYALRVGTPDPQAVTSAYWLRKPDGTSYGDFFDRFDPLVATHGGALWQRQMVLGPAPEFCWRTPGSVPLPPDLIVQAIRLVPGTV